MCDIRTDLFIAPRHTADFPQSYSEGTEEEPLAASSYIKRLSWIRSTRGGGWVYNNSVPEAKTEVPDN
jgi:hypothetical protein